MYDQLRARELPISKLAQNAFADALARDENAAWIAAARARPLRATAISSEALMAEVDEEFGG